MHSCSSVPSPAGRLSEDSQQISLDPEETPQGKEARLASPDNQDGEEGVAEGANKFYCYLCSITCHSQQVKLDARKHTQVTGCGRYVR